jgi:hypothetical protein
MLEMPILQRYNVAFGVKWTLRREAEAERRSVAKENGTDIAGIQDLPCVLSALPDTDPRLMYQICSATLLSVIPSGDAGTNFALSGPCSCKNRSDLKRSEIQIAAEVEM